jgi:hypothetical protein
MELSVSHGFKLNEIALFHAIPAMERISVSAEIALMLVFFHEVDKRRHVRVEVLIAFFNF